MLAANITLAEPVVYPAGRFPAGLAAGDVNADGTLDLVVNSGLGQDRQDKRQPTLLLGQGDGTFKRPIDLNFLPGDLADFNNDGYLDSISPTGLRLGIAVSLNMGGTAERWMGFGEQQTFLIEGASVPQGRVAIGDFNHDEYVDIAVGDNQVVWVSLNQGVSDQQWSGFGEFVSHDAGHFPISPVAGDLDADGDLDLVVGNYFGGDVSVLLGSGDGTFRHLDNFPVGRRASSVVAGDFDGDGDLDIAARVSDWENTSDANDMAVLKGNGDGTFSPPAYYPTELHLSGLTAGDLDADGDLDIAAISVAGNEVRLVINQGDGTFVEKEEDFHTTAGNQQDFTMADLDGDGDQDLAVATGSFFGCNGCGINVFLNSTNFNVAGVATIGSQTLGDNLAGEFELDGAQVVTFDLNGEDQSSDLLRFEGNLHIDGSTLQVNLLGGIPTEGIQFQLLETLATTGWFDHLLLPELPEELMWNTSQLYQQGILRVDAAGPRGDFDGDGEVSFRDFQILSSTFGKVGAGLLADADDNDAVDFGDFLILSQNFGAIRG